MATWRLREGQSYLNVGTVFIDSLRTLDLSRCFHDTPTGAIYVPDSDISIVRVVDRVSAAVRVTDDPTAFEAKCLTPVLALVGSQITATTVLARRTDGIFEDLPNSGANGISTVPDTASLPESAVGNPVVLVLADDQAEGKAALRYWSGSSWILIGLAGGGTISSDYIDVPTDLAGITGGRTLIWFDGDSEFKPGALS